MVQLGEDGLGRSQGGPLGRSGRGALVYGAAFTIFRDALQFATMVVLVRLLTPSEYGQMALAQACIGVLAIGTCRTFLLHALQVRDPATIDWQSHFSAGLLINVAFFLLTLIFAGVLRLATAFQSAALPLAVLSLLFLVEVPASLRFTMVQVAHDWKRFRILTVAGAILGCVTAVGIASLGGGAVALTAPVVLFGLPAALDLFLLAGWRPDFSFSRCGYRDVVRFGLSRIGSSGAMAIKNATESARVAGSFDLGMLGIYSRSVGLANLSAGRVGTVTMQSLYPVVTRAPAGSDRFRRIAGLILRAVGWVTILAGALVWLVADDLVMIVYGPRWGPVSDLLPLAVAYASLSGITTTSASLLLANEDVALATRIEVLFSLLAVPVILTAVPMGVRNYLAAMIALAATSMLVTLWCLVRRDGLEPAALWGAFFPPSCAAVFGAIAVVMVRQVLSSAVGHEVRCAIECSLFGLISVASIRILFQRALGEALAVAPAGDRLAKVLLLKD